MKTRIHFCVSTGLAITAALALFGLSLAGYAQESTIFTYQGRLNNSAGQANGAYDLKFSIYDSTNQPGVLIAGPLTNFTVAVSNGLFTVPLDFGVAPFDGSDRWLEIGVRTNGAGSFTTLASRQQVTLAPYAIMARASLFAVSNFTVGANLVLPPTNVTFYSGGGTVFRSDSSQENVFLGPGAGDWPVLSSQANTAVGNNALASGTTGGDNSAFGDGALWFNTTGIANTAVGVSAMQGNTNGNFNTALGSFALGGFANGSSGSHNTAEGYLALSSLVGGVDNTANGAFALASSTNSSGSVADGYQALYGNLTGSQNTAVGFRALYSNTNGGLNTAVGDLALYFATGNDNIGIGDEAGYLLGSGSLNIHIGNIGTASDDHLIKIGQQGTQTATYIAGISQTSIVGAVPVYVNANGQLGSVAPAFVHTANAGNIQVRGTVINNALCNGRPNAILTVTPVNGLRDQIFVAYISPNWEIIYVSQNMQAGDTFNVFVANP